MKIAADNSITIIAPRAEMGQGISTTLAALVAEELDVDARQGQGASTDRRPTPISTRRCLRKAARSLSSTIAWSPKRCAALLALLGKVLGLQATGGSSSTRDGFDRMRQAGAAARTMLLQAAATRLSVSSERADHRQWHDRARRLQAEPDLWRGRRAMPQGSILPATSSSRTRQSGSCLASPQQRVDMRDKVTGAPIFGIDVRAAGHGLRHGSG